MSDLSGRVGESTEKHIPDDDDDHNNSSSFNDSFSSMKSGLQVLLHRYVWRSSSSGSGSGGGGGAFEQL